MEEILGADVARKAIADAMVRHSASPCGICGLAGENPNDHNAGNRMSSFTRMEILPVNTAVSCSDCCIGAAGDVQRRVPAPPDPVAAAPDRHMPAARADSSSRPAIPWLNWPRAAACWQLAAATMTADKTTDGTCGSCRHRTMIAPSPALSVWRFVEMSQTCPKNVVNNYSHRCKSCTSGACQCVS